MLRLCVLPAFNPTSCAARRRRVVCSMTLMAHFTIISLILPITLLKELLYYLRCRLDLSFQGLRFQAVIIKLIVDVLRYIFNVVLLVVYLLILYRSIPSTEDGSSYLKPVRDL